MTMGSTDRRIASLKIAAQMHKRFTKDDAIPTAELLIEYAGKLERFAYREEDQK